MEISIQRDGLRLCGRIDRPTKPGKCPAVILMHGFTGDLGYEEDSFYQKLTKRLTGAGILVVRFDFNGHGKSDGNFSDMDVFNEIEDAIAVLKYVRQQDFVTGIYLLGHSQGGVVAGMLAGYYADVIEKLVLLAPAASLKEDAQKGVCMDTAYDTEHIPETVCVSGEHFVGGHYFRIAKLLPIYEVTGQYQGPSLVIHGRYDAIVDAAAAVRYKEYLKQCELKLMEGIDHGFQGEDQDRAMDAVVEFLSQ